MLIFGKRRNKEDNERRGKQIPFVEALKTRGASQVLVFKETADEYNLHFKLKFGCYDQEIESRLQLKPRLGVKAGMDADLSRDTVCLFLWRGVRCRHFQGNQKSSTKGGVVRFDPWYSWFCLFQPAFLCLYFRGVAQWYFKNQLLRYFSRKQLVSREIIGVYNLLTHLH